MTAHPILILQMQRMGDLVLSFPLFNQLRRHYPNHPLWVVGEEQFFVPLMPLSPQVTYFPYSSKAALQKTRFSLIINLSHRAEAAELAGSLRCDELIGPYRRNGEQYIKGKWQLYRASIAHNNHYNRFHWTDLNAFDCIPLPVIEQTAWPPVRAKTSPSPCRVGLFLGASEQSKRPDVVFWTGLARYLLRKGFHPVLLGGIAEKTLGQEVAKGLGSHALNLCGRFDVHQLYLFIKELNALISPDTGPMHIATWAGTRVVNLSMGNVSPWETGPMSPGHFVIRGNVPCLNCWQCTRPQVLCKEAFKPAHVGRCIEALLTSPDAPSIPETVNNLHMLRSARRNGLHGLEPLAFSGSQPFLNSEGTLAHAALARFWQNWFANTLGLGQTPASPQEAPYGADMAPERETERYPELTPEPALAQSSKMACHRSYEPVSELAHDLIPQRATKQVPRRAPKRAPQLESESALPPRYQKLASATYSIGTESACLTALRDLCAAHPDLCDTLVAEGQRLLLAFSHAIKTGNNPFVDDADFWRRFADPLLPLTGFLQLLIQNAASPKEGFHAALRLCEKFLGRMTQ